METSISEFHPVSNASSKFVTLQLNFTASKTELISGCFFKRSFAAIAPGSHSV